MSQSNWLVHKYNFQILFRISVWSYEMFFITSLCFIFILMEYKSLISLFSCAQSLSFRVFHFASDNYIKPQIDIVYNFQSGVNTHKFYLCFPFVFPSSKLSIIWLKYFLKISLSFSSEVFSFSFWRFSYRWAKE